MVHETVPVEADRWIGVVPMPGRFNDHCLVMSGSELLFDPIDPQAYSRRVRIFSPADITYGFSFQPHGGTKHD